MSESYRAPEQEKSKEAAVDAFIEALKRDLEPALAEAQLPYSERKQSRNLPYRAERLQKNAEYDFGKVRKAVLEGTPIVIVANEMEDSYDKTYGGGEQEAFRFQIFVQLDVDANGTMIIKNIGNMVEMTTESTTERISPKHKLSRHAMPVTNKRRPFVLKAFGLKTGAELKPKGFFSLTHKKSRTSDIITETTTGKELYAAREGFQDEWGNRFSQMGEVKSIEK